MAQEHGKRSVGISGGGTRRLCYCENEHCQLGHRDDLCPNSGTVAVQFVGWICEPCAAFMPAEYLR